MVLGSFRGLLNFGVNGAIATGLATMALMMPTEIGTRTAQAGENPLLESSDVPLNLTLGDLDGSWRKFRTSGQYEFGDLMKSWSTLFGLPTFNNVYYTQGKIIEMAGNRYVVAYRFPVVDSSSSMGDMFSMSQWDVDCDALPQTTLSLESSLSLALLNPATIGSLNDIQAVDVQGEIQRSQAEAEEKMKTCQEQAAEGSAYDAEMNMGSINRAQQAFQLEMGEFATSIEELGIGLESETDFYRYSMAVRSPDFVTTQALQKSEQGYHYVGGVAVLEDEMGYEYTSTVLCESEAIPGKLPSPPTFNASTGILTCPVGSYELY